MPVSLCLIFDTETCGLILQGVPSDDPRQPHLVQFAALLIDIETRQEVESVNVLVRPNGWQVPPEATAIHGITHVRALARGVSEESVVNAFIRMQDAAAITVAHNARFDIAIMRIAMLRYDVTRAEADRRTQLQNACTMQCAAPIVNLPPTERMLAAGLRVPKAPKLSECMKHFFDEEHDGAHDAMADARACARVYLHLIDAHGIRAP